VLRDTILDEAVKGFFEFANGVCGLPMLNRFGGALINVQFQHSPPDLVKGSAYYCHLGEHVIDLAAFLPHAFEAVGMTSNASQPFGDLLTGSGSSAG
jgi:hypothetical protein